MFQYKKKQLSGFSTRADCAAYSSMEENVVNHQSSSNRRGRSRRSRGTVTGGRYNRSVHSDSAQTSHSTNSSVTTGTESSNTQHAAAAPTACSLFSLTSDQSAARGPRRRGSGNRRPWRARHTSRPDSEPFVRQSYHSSGIQQTGDCSLPYHLAFSAGMSESVNMNVGLHPVSNIQAGKPTGASNRGNSVTPHERGGLAHSTRAQLNFRRPRPVGWRSQGTPGRYDHTVHTAYDSMQTYYDTNSSVAAAAEACSAYNTVTASVCPDHSAARGTWKRGRANRRPWRAKNTSRPDSVPFGYQSDYSSGMQQLEDFSLTSYAVSEFECQFGNMNAPVTPAVITNRGRNARHRGRGRFMHGTRGQHFRQPVSNQSDSVSFENNETQRQITGSAPFESTTYEELELETMSNAETDEWVDDDGDILEARNVPVSSRGKQRNWNVRTYKVHGNRRGNRGLSAGRMLDVLECEHISQDTTDTDSVADSISGKAATEDVANEQWIDVDSDIVVGRNEPATKKGKQKNRGNRAKQSTKAGSVCDVVEQKTTDAESTANSVPGEAAVRDAAKEQGTNPGSNNSGRRQKNAKQKVTSCDDVHEMAGSTPVPATTASRSDAAAVTPVTSDMKLADVGVHKMDSSRKPAPRIDENSLFWHLVNEHAGRCCIDELRNQLNTSDADHAVAILLPLKRIKILVNESNKWRSVAFVFLRGLRMCLRVRAGCRNENCAYLHVCPDYVAESCLAGQQCHLGHNVRIPCNQLCLQKCGIPPGCSSESILTIARCSVPVICAGYNGLEESQCLGPDQCIRFHVCNEFFCNRCLIPASKCILGHDLTSAHNARLLPLYELQHLLTDKLRTLHQMILPFNRNTFAHSLAHTSGGKPSTALPTVTAPQTSRPQMSDFVAAMRPNVRTEVQIQSGEGEMTGTVQISLVSGDQLFAASATQPSFSQQAQRPVTLQRFVAGHGLTSKTQAAPAGVQITKLAEDTRDESFSSVSAEKVSTGELNASVKSDANKTTENEAYVLRSDKRESSVESAPPNETVTAVQPDVMQQSVPGRSRSAETFEINAGQCQSYVKHVCNDSSECAVRHSALPYLWRVQDAGKWVAFDDSDLIEQAFCSPDNTTYQVCIHLYKRI